MTTKATIYEKDGCYIIAVNYGFTDKDILVVDEIEFSEDLVKQKETLKELQLVGEIRDE